MEHDNLSKEVTVATFAKAIHLESLSPNIDMSLRPLSSYSTHRPSLQLAGYFEYFETSPQKRIQFLGRMEQSYMSSLDRRVCIDRIETIASYRVPCLVFTRGYHPDSEIIRVCEKYGVPVLYTERSTTEVITESNMWLRIMLAPRITVHGVLMDIYGEGVLIQGDSGIGKSEAALELIKRGHRLVADDAVEIRKISDVSLVGLAPELTRDMIELRGIGIVNARALFGAESVKMTQGIDMVIRLEEYIPGKVYDRMGLEDQYTEIMGNKVISYLVPVRPGRNIAVILESAAVNNRTKVMGENTAEEFFARVSRMMQR